MPPATRSAWAMVVCLIFTCNAMAAPPELQLRWADLATQVRGHQITLELPDGSHLNGIVRAVGADSMEMQLASGTQSIPRASVHRFTLEKKSRNTRLIGAAVGGGILAASAGVGYAINDYSGIFVAILGGAIGIGVIVTSLILGHGRRTNSTTVTVVG